MLLLCPLYNSMQKDKPTECLIISLAKLMMNHSKRNDYKKVNSSFWHSKRVLCTPSRIRELSFFSSRGGGGGLVETGGSSKYN